MHNFLCEAAHRETEQMTDQQAWSHNLHFGGDNNNNCPWVRLALELLRLCGGLGYINVSLVFLWQPRQNLINAASRVGDASYDIMYHVEPDSELDSAYKVKLLYLLRICIQCGTGCLWCYSQFWLFLPRLLVKPVKSLSIRAVS